jgi:hypothetical protein
MGKLTNFKKIIIDNKSYIVSNLNYNGNIVPIILDSNILNTINKLNKKWHINDNGSVVTTHKHINDDGEEILKEIYLHDIVLKFNNVEPNKPVIHINKLGIDNRFINLMLDTHVKKVTKNLNKKSRTVILPDNSGINIDEIPSFVWYMKPDSSHGNRFLIDIGDVQWKTSSSKKLSLRYKLEEAKKFLRSLKETKSYLFDIHSMNGDLNITGRKNLDSFIDISQKAGYTNLNNNSRNNNNNTDVFLKENLTGLTEFEINLLASFNPPIL